MPLSGFLARWGQWVIPDSGSASEGKRSTHLDRELLRMPLFALAQVRSECLELGERVRRFMEIAKLACLVFFSASHSFRM